MAQPEWMAEAWQRLGARELPGNRHNRDIVAMFRDAGRPEVTRDEVPWCAAFVGAVLERAGRAGTNSLRARSYLEWGEALAAPRLGAIVVLSRGSNPAAGHVGFWLGETAGTHILLGGNQSDAVTVQGFAKARLLGLRWPRGGIETGAAAGDAQRFRPALGHVLAMEGGFTDDPDDPGGPTNKGITLAVFCRHTGRPLGDATRDRRISELRAIPDALVEEIYRTRYWHPSRAPEMPDAIGFMHFDAAVNHGLSGAAKILQRALREHAPGLAIDGEIGPRTMAAVQGAEPGGLLRRYAEQRRAWYRALRHFWKFGRGWLRRVARTEGAARERLIAAPPAAPQPTTSAKGEGMTTIETQSPPAKWWGHSMTIWGAAITALSTVLPIVGPAIGVDVTPDIVREAGEQIIAIVQAIGGLAGTILTIYGRTRAVRPLERRQLNVQI